MSHIMPEPEAPPPLPVDPNLAQEKADAKAFKTSTLQDQLRGDSASIMARYGTNLAYAGTSGYPVAAAAPSAPSMPSINEVQSSFGNTPFAPFLGGALSQMGFKN